MAGSAGSEKEMLMSDRTPDRDARLPRWLKVSGIVAILVVLLVVVVMLASGGGHGPGRHFGHGG